MKYTIYRILVSLVFLILIIVAKDWPGWFGAVVGLSLVVHSEIQQWITKKETIAKEEKEYEQWVKEMNARANYRIEEF